MPARNGFNGFLRALPDDRALLFTVVCGYGFVCARFGDLGEIAHIKPLNAHWALHEMIGAVLGGGAAKCPGLSPGIRILEVSL
jgi:hypothetical protein